jgi:hypothetical protein
MQLVIFGNCIQTSEAAGPPPPVGPQTVNLGWGGLSIPNQIWTKYFSKGGKLAKQYDEIKNKCQTIFPENNRLTIFLNDGRRVFFWGNMNGNSSIFTVHTIAIFE